MDLHGAFHVYDTTLRDGAQQEGLNLSVADKLSIARQLDGLGVGYIEGGWPGANPKDTEFFRRAAGELDLRHARLAAFGATRRAGAKAAGVVVDDAAVTPRYVQGLKPERELSIIRRIATGRMGGVRKRNGPAR